MTNDQRPGTGPEEAERHDYAALVDSLADTLDLRSGLSEAVDIVDYTAMSGHIAGFLDLEAGLQSALDVSTRADAEPPLRASAEKATDSVADLPLPIGAWDAAWDEIFRRPGRLVSTAVRSFRQQEAGLQSALAVSTRADAEPPLRASAEKATDSVADLLLRIADGDAAAWDEIFRRYGKLVSTAVRSFRLQEADALDAVQMTWLRLAENARRVQFPERLGGWLATTARRECLHILRHAKPITGLTDVAPDTIASLSAGPEQRAGDTDTVRTLRKLVAELSPRQQTLLRMLFTDDPRSYAEVARTARIPPGGIGPTRARALRQLKVLSVKKGDYPIPSTSSEAFSSPRPDQPPVRLQPCDNLGARSPMPHPADPGEDQGDHESVEPGVETPRGGEDSATIVRLRDGIDHVSSVSDSDSSRTSAEDYRAVFGAVREVVTDYLTGAHWTLTSPYVQLVCKILKDFEQAIRDNMEPFIRNRKALEEFLSGPGEKLPEKVPSRLGWPDKTVDSAEEELYRICALPLAGNSAGGPGLFQNENSGEDRVSRPENDTTNEDERDSR